MKKALVLFSGGLDSTTCLALAIKEYGVENVIALSIYYGQRHDKELQAAKDVVDYYKVRHIQLDLSYIFKESDCTLLKQNPGEIPLGSYAEEHHEIKDDKPLSTYVPFRNGLFLSVAASEAISLGCEIIYYGIHCDEIIGAAYPDCSLDFNDAITKAIFLGSGKQIMVKAPFVNKPKSEVVKTGLELKVPYELTWSCYEGHDKACGKCGTCVDRIKAFEENGVVDPIEYED